MRKLKIGIVDDELLIARNLSNVLRKLGYDTAQTAMNYAEAVTVIEAEKPDLMLLDINLKDHKDGIDVGAYLNAHHPIPFIFLTANSDPATIERAKKVVPNAYLVKPFQEEEIYAAIEIAMASFEKKILEKPVAPSNPQPVFSDSIVVKDGDCFFKINISEILYLESDRNYVTIHTQQQKRYIVRYSLSEMLERLPQEPFLRIHRSYALRLDAVEKITPSEVELGGVKLPITKQAKEELLLRWEVLK